MKVTRLGPPRPIINSGLGGNAGHGVPGGGSALQVLTSDGSNGRYWGENVRRITSNGSNILLSPDVNIASGTGVIFSFASNTLTIAASGGAGSALTIEEVDGSPTVSATKLVLPNGTLGVVGTVATYTPAGGGGGLSQSFIGYNTIGGTWENGTAKREYMKKVTLSATTTFQSIDMYIRGTTDDLMGASVGILADNAGSPDVLLAANVIPVAAASGSLYLSNSASMPSAARWLSIPIGATLAAGDYWIAVMLQPNYFDIAKDTGGSDRYFTSSVYTISGTYPSAFSVTTTTDRYSIRASVLS